MSLYRKFELHGPYRYRRRFPNNSWEPYQTWQTSSNSEMESVNHGWPINTDGDDGGPWWLDKFVDVSYDADQRVLYPGATWAAWEGPITVGNPRQTSWESASAPTMMDDLELRGQGTTMIARSMPTNPSFDLATSLGELREGLPSMVGLQTLRNRSQLAKAAGGEFLNIEFGWKPLVSEVRGLASAVQSSHDTWQSYRKGSSKKTRVGYHLEDEESTREYNGEFIPFPSQFYLGFPKGKLVEQVRRHTWFSGAFKYHIPEPGVDFADKFGYWRSQASKILGARLTPDTLWELSPWSWAIDWFSNTGDLMHNISQLGNDGLVLQYGYAMAERSVFTHKTATFSNARMERSTLKKLCKRLPASPFGFDAQLSSLSEKQLAILAAVGLSRT